MREFVLTAIAHRESIIQPAFMPATLKRVRTIFIFNRAIEGMTIGPIEHLPCRHPRAKLCGKRRANY